MVATVQGYESNSTSLIIGQPLPSETQRLLVGNPFAASGATIQTVNQVARAGDTVYLTQSPDLNQRQNAIADQIRHVISQPGFGGTLLITAFGGDSTPLDVIGAMRRVEDDLIRQSPDSDLRRVYMLNSSFPTDPVLRAQMAGVNLVYAHINTGGEGDDAANSGNPSVRAQSSWNEIPGKVKDFVRTLFGWKRTEAPNLKPRESDIQAVKESLNQGVIGSKNVGELELSGGHRRLMHHSATVGVSADAFERTRGQTGPGTNVVRKIKGVGALIDFLRTKQDTYIEWTDPNTKETHRENLAELLVYGVPVNATQIGLTGLPHDGLAALVIPKEGRLSWKAVALALELAARGTFVQAARKMQHSSSPTLQSWGENLMDIGAQLLSSESRLVSQDLLFPGKSHLNFQILYNQAVEFRFYDGPGKDAKPVGRITQSGGEYVYDTVQGKISNPHALKVRALPNVLTLDQVGSVDYRRQGQRYQQTRHAAKRTSSFAVPTTRVGRAAVGLRTRAMSAFRRASMH